MARINEIGACLFDAYGTLFDVSSVAAQIRHEIGEQAETLSQIWRQKQLEYTWLRSLMGRHEAFWQVTADGLDYAMTSLGMEDMTLRDRLMEGYLKLDCYREIPQTLSELHQTGMKLAILSNGSPHMLNSAVENAQLTSYLDAVLSIEEVGIYKPHPSVYQLAVDRLGIPAARICFLSSNAWDAAGAASFGFRVVWINRFNQTPERLGVAPEAEIYTLDELLPLLDLNPPSVLT